MTSKFLRFPHLLTKLDNFRKSRDNIFLGNSILCNFFPQTFSLQPTATQLYRKTEKVSFFQPLFIYKTIIRNFFPGIWILLLYVLSGTNFYKKQPAYTFFIKLLLVLDFMFWSLILVYMRWLLRIQVENVIQSCCTQLIEINKHWTKQVENSSKWKRMHVLKLLKTVIEHKFPENRVRNSEFLLLLIKSSGKYTNKRGGSMDFFHETKIFYC